MAQKESTDKAPKLAAPAVKKSVKGAPSARVVYCGPTIPAVDLTRGTAYAAGIPARAADLLDAVPPLRGCFVDRKDAARALRKNDALDRRIIELVAAHLAAKAAEAN